MTSTSTPVPAKMTRLYLELLGLSLGHGQPKVESVPGVIKHDHDTAGLNRIWSTVNKF